jgi:hypothetical protein
MRHFAAPALALAVTLTLTGCQQQANLLTDPNAILAAAASSTASATSVHVDVTADGPIAFDPLGTGAGAAINLRGTTAAADIDLAKRNLRATFSSPNLMGIAAEVIVLDGSAYLKSSLTGANYLKTAVPDVPVASPAPSAQALGGLMDVLTKADLQPVKGDDVPCAGGTCYAIKIHLTPEKLTALGGGSGIEGAIPSAPIPGITLPNIADASADLSILVEQASTRLSGIDAVVHLGDVGDPHIVVTFTKWNEPVTLAAPPPDEVAPAP